MEQNKIDCCMVSFFRKNRTERFNGKKFYVATDTIECRTFESAKMYADATALNDETILSAKIEVVFEDGDRIPFDRAYRFEEGSRIISGTKWDSLQEIFD